MAVLKLTERAVQENCVPIEGKVQAHYWDSDLKGFGVIVGQTGIKTFVIQHRKLRVVGPAGEKCYPRFSIFISQKHLAAPP